MHPNKCKVLFCIPNFNGGGAERIAIQLAQSLDKNAFDVAIFAHEKWGPLMTTIELDIPVFYGSEAAYSRLNLISTLAKNISVGKNYDIIVGANEGRASFFAFLTAKFFNKAFVGWLHVNWSEFSSRVSWRQKFALRIYKYSDHVVTVSQGVLNSFKKIRSDLGTRATVIYNGIDLHNINELAQKALSAQDSKIFNSPSVVVAAGRLAYQKDFDLLIRSFALVSIKNPDAQLVILGEGPDRNTLAELSRTLGIASAVHLLGFKENPYSYMAKGAMFVMTSRFEGFPLVLLEAQACGLPVVSVNCPSGPAEVLQNGNAGVLVNNRDPEKIADEIIDFLDDRSKRNHFSNVSRERAQDFDFKYMRSSWERLLHDVHKRHSLKKL